uniref:Uncharacterized protein n=1 Tax=Dictyoglomus thermophilum TaxID=14 RepID=A0A7C3RL03_DICTH
MKKLIISLLISIFFVFSLSYAQENPNSIKLIGVAIASSIEEDEYGLTLIDGIFSIINFDSLPQTDTFSLYSRWMGNGKYDIEINLLNPSKEKILGTIDDSFELTRENEVFYFWGNFEDIAFDEPGVYWIQVKADGKLLKEIPLFVLENDEDIDIPENLTQKPILAFTLPALEIYENDYGLTSLKGIYEYYATDELPFTDSFIIANGWMSGESEYNQHIEIFSPDKKLLYKSEPQSFETNAGSIITLFDEISNFSFEKEGDYLVKVFLDDEEVNSFVLKVIKE